MRCRIMKKGGVFLVFVVICIGSYFPSISGDLYNHSTYEKRSINDEPYERTSFLSDPPEEEWNRTYGTEDSEWGYTGYQNDDGGYNILAGKPSENGGPFDFWFMKVDSTGNIQWDNTSEKPIMDEFISSQPTSDNGYIILGVNEIPWTLNYTFLLAKYDENGVKQWEKSIGDPVIGIFGEVRQTADDGYIIIGTMLNDSSNDVFLGYYLIKTDFMGNLEWGKVYRKSIANIALNVQQTKDGGYILVGAIGTDIGGIHIDSWIIKTDQNGDIQWETIIRGLNDSVAFSVEQTTDGGYIIAGETCPIVDSGEKGDVWLIKINANGIQQWNRTFGGPEVDFPWSVQQTNDEGYIIIGTTKSFDVGGQDIWVIKTDSVGSEEWNRTFGGIEFDSASTIQQTADGGYVIIGGTWSYGAGAADVWVIKLESEEANHPPDKPDIEGPTGGYVNVSYTYNFTSNDPEGDDISYFIDWDDGSTSSWSSFISSGDTYSSNHIWNKEGSYNLKVKAKDEHGDESEWSNLLIDIKKDSVPPLVKISKPERALYFFDKKIRNFILSSRIPLIIGKITIEANATDEESGINRVEFYVNGRIMGKDTSDPFTYLWRWRRPRIFHIIVLKVVAYDNEGNTAIDKMIVRKFL